MFHRVFKGHRKLHRAFKEQRTLHNAFNDTGTGSFIQPLMATGSFQTGCFITPLRTQEASYSLSWQLEAFIESLKDTGNFHRGFEGNGIGSLKDTVSFRDYYFQAVCYFHVIFH